MNIFTKFFEKIIPGKRIIFIVEDNEVYSKSLKAFIQSRVDNVKEIKCFGTGEMCLRELHRKPNVVIVDYFLNSRFETAYNGLELIKRIRAQQMQTNIIVLSAQEKFSVILEVIKEYDCTYVQKDEEAFNYVAHMINELFDHKTSEIFEPEIK